MNQSNGRSAWWLWGENPLNAEVCVKDYFSCISVQCDCSTALVLTCDFKVFILFNLTSTCQDLGELMLNCKCKESQNLLDVGLGFGRRLIEGLWCLLKVFQVLLKRNRTTERANACKCHAYDYRCTVQYNSAEFSSSGSRGLLFGTLPW